MGAVDELVHWWKENNTNCSYIRHQVMHMVVKIEYNQEGWRGIFSKTYTYEGEKEGEHCWS